MRKPTNIQYYAAVLAEVQAKNPNALGYQVEEMATREYEHRYALIDDGPAFAPDLGDELDKFFAGKFGKS